MPFREGISQPPVVGVKLSKPNTFLLLLSSNCMIVKLMQRIIMNVVNLSAVNLEISTNHKTKI